MSTSQVVSQTTVRDGAASPVLVGEALVDPQGQLWLPYDVALTNGVMKGWTQASSHRHLRHAGRAPFVWEPPVDGCLHIINGMGVTLGDSIVGFNALAWLVARYPGLRIHLYRSARVPRYVRELYDLAGAFVHRVHALPCALDTIPDGAIDVSDFLRWPTFAQRPMVDFFFASLGLDPAAVPAAAKTNAWLSTVPRSGLPLPFGKQDYVLCCGGASTPLRRVPPEHAAALVDRIWGHYRKPVLGFGPVQHPQYLDVAAHSQSIDQFIAWIARAAVVVSGDSAAVHVAAAYDIPTLAVFASIEPRLRTRDYRRCVSVDLRNALSDGLHECDDPLVLQAVANRWRTFIRSEIAWPEVVSGRPPTRRPGAIRACA